jgi:cell division topological specificity factor
VSSIFQLFRKRATSAPLARERLQILLSHERAAVGGSDIVAMLQEEIIAVIRKHLPVDRDKVVVKLERGEAMSLLEIDVEMPSFPERPRLAASA